MKTMVASLLPFFILFSSCVVVTVEKNEDRDVFGLTTITTTEGMVVDVLMKDSTFMILPPQNAIYSTLRLGKYFLIPQNSDSMDQETLFFEDTILSLTRPFPYLGEWSGWNENILTIVPNVSTRTIYVIVEMQTNLDSKKKIRVVRVYDIDEYGRPIPVKQTEIPRKKYIGDL